MEWLERNLDAYRLIAEVLTELRSTLRRDLERVHGKTWFRIGLPEGLLDRLIAAKEQEKAIDWYENEYQQVMDYAVFPDLLEVLEFNAEHFPALTTLAPSLAILHARFLELEVVRSKLGRARPVSDAEISFLGTFSSRFRAAMAKRPADDTSEAPEDASPVPPKAPAGATPKVAPKPETGPGGTSPADEDDREQEATSAQDPPVEAAPQRAATRPPQRPARRAGDAATPIETPLPTAPATAEPESESERPSLLKALEDGDSRNVLRELYREVTSIADGIWSSGMAPSTPMWDAVSTSSWYETNFSKIGLRPLSDFYEVVSQVTSRIEQGVGRNELQKFLKDSNFAQVLLAMRDMFQKVGI